MSAIRKFEDLECWQEAKQLVVGVYLISKDGPLSKDFGARDQVRRAAISVMNNIAEGFGRESNREFARFLEISQSSCMEVKSMLYLFDHLNYSSPETLQQLHAKTDRVKALTRGLIKYLRANPEH